MSFMKILFFLFIISKSAFMFGQNNQFLNMFDLTDEVNTTNFDSVRFSKKIPLSFVLDFLCENKNECLYNVLNRNEYFYYPLYKIDCDSFWLISYLRTDNYENSIFLKTFDKDGFKRSSQLHVFENIGLGEPSLHSFTRNNELVISRKMKKECADDLTEDCFYFLEEVYNLDFKLSSVNPIKDEESPKIILEIEK